MASRTSEPAYWESHQLPHNQYPSQQHYYSSAPAMVNQQQPRQAPTFNSAAESSSPYSAPPSSNVYYGSFYQSTGPVNGSGMSQNNNSSSSNSINNNAASTGGPNYTAMSNGNGNNGHPGSQVNGGNHGPSSNFAASPHGVNMPLPHVMAPYPPMGGHSGYHLSNNGMYQRSHGSGGGDFAGPMTHAGEDLPPLQPHPQHMYHSSSQHSASPTIDGSEYGQGMKQKRRQVKNACVNCQKACKRCDEGRPCTRCIKYGLTDTCQDSSRKERKRGIKRGPYKRRATTGSQTASSSSGSQYPSTSSFLVMDNGLQSAPFLGHHNNGPHGSFIGGPPHMRNHRDLQNGSSGMSEAGGHHHHQHHHQQHQGIESGLLNSPGYPTSAPGTVQRSMGAPLINHEGVYNRDHFHAMQPPRFTSRHDYERNSNSPAQSMSLYSSNRSNALPPPVSAPASSTSFASSPASGYSSRSLFSPPSLLSANSANFLSANGHHRLHSDSSINTMTTGSTANSSLSPRTPMSMGGTGSGSMAGGDIGLMQSLSANSSTSSPPGGKGSSGHGYVHHPGPTTTTSLPLTATGAFLNPPSAPSNNAQPFPLHIPHSARWRSSNGGSTNGEREHLIRNRDEKEEQLAPIKLHNSNDSDLSNGNLSIRYQLPSPRMAESPRGDQRINMNPKVDAVA